ncbi:MAG TPA: hypothetical protein VLG47_00185 [Candidatus Saccharimonadales bacterium]|nr:hypothetical protein [Candidatus Saccharimonadales bacterium]
MSELPQTSPNAAFMKNEFSRIGVTPEGATLLEGFMASHQHDLENPEQGMRNIDGVAVLVNDGTVISVIMQRSVDMDFMVTTTSLSDLHNGTEPKVNRVPYGLQWKDGYMRVRTDRGVLKYSSHGGVELVDPDDSDKRIPVVEISSFLASRAEAEEAKLVAAAQESQTSKPPLLSSALGWLTMRRPRRK